MSIEQRCKEQQVFADRIFMDFKYTQAGSKEQINALEMFHSQVCMWCDYLRHSETTQWASPSTLEATAKCI